MDYKLISIVLLIGHLLGDFYFQPQSMAKNKDKVWKAVLCNGLIYMAAIVLPFMLLYAIPPAALGFILLIPSLHIVFDIAKSCLSRKHFERRQEILFAAFVADQLIHLITIVLVAYYYAINVPVAYSCTGIYLSKLYASLHLGLSADEFIRLACLFLFLGKPVNIFVSKILETIAVKERLGSNTDQKAGRIIGILERYLTVILVILGQYTAVGFAFTAKSVTRFSKISEDQDFAEQYLIGTMSSLLFALIGTILYLL
jgi:hypothetical protein